MWLFSTMELKVKWIKKSSFWGNILPLDATYNEVTKFFLNHIIKWMFKLFPTTFPTWQTFQLKYNDIYDVPRKLLAPQELRQKSATVSK